MDDGMNGALNGAVRSSMYDGSASSAALALPPDVTGALLAGSSAGGLGVPTPFSTKILLEDEEVIVGTSHVADIDAIVEGLQMGDRLRFRRQPDNPHDANCIQVLAPDGRRLGFVAATRNKILARLMDGGKTLYGRLINISKRDSWYRLVMEVYLED